MTGPGVHLSGPAPNFVSASSCDARNSGPEPVSGWSPRGKTFRALGARPWEERCRAEIAATGVQLAPVRQGPAALLTRQELQVALIVAAGASNREAACRLFLSPKTVEYHLKHVYDKLATSG